MNIELYINGQLCDIGNPRDLGIVLKRVFIKPSELNTKDAQKSYEITLPATPHNNDIFAHINIEEVQGKFTTYPDAQLYIDGIKILDGKFRLSSISKDSYRGNLGVPAPLTVKDIFGETTMNQAGKWMIPFNGVPDLSYYNALDYKDIRSGKDEYNYGNIPPCIFPFVLYKLLTKEGNNGIYSPKDVLDSSVRFTLDDFPPSVNCVHMLKQIFRNAGYTLTGSALSDPRISNLFVSYKNPNDYEIQWGTGEIKLHGEWSNLLNGNVELNKGNTGLQSSYETGYIGTDLMVSNNSRIQPVENGTGSINIDGNKAYLTIPQDGLYKLTFDVQLELGENIAKVGKENLYIYPGTLEESCFEVKILRNVPDRQLFPHITFDNVFVRNNINQEIEKDGNLYPAQDQVNFIDPYQETLFICGFNWGNVDRKIPNYKRHINPLDYKAIKANPMAISGGKSWTTEHGSAVDPIEDRYYSAIYSPGYNKYPSNEYDGKFQIELQDAPALEVTIHSNKKATGKLSQIVWLEKGDDITLMVNCSMIKKQLAENFQIWCWLNQKVTFDLSLELFQTDQNWLTNKMNNNNASTEPIRWSDSGLHLGDINLVSSLPANIKINDWIDNFCKAFNLNIINIDNKRFELNIKNRDVVSNTSSIIDLDQKTNIKLCQNEPLNLPYMYDLGFTIDSAEEGYYRSMEYEVNEEGKITEEKKLNSGIDGGGKFYTGSRETSKVEQKSNFSYCWYRQIKDLSQNKEIDIPVITDHEIWDNVGDYEEMKDNKYYEKAQRFWYRQETHPIKINHQHDSSVALVSNNYNTRDKKLILDYEEKAGSIMYNYFLLLTNEKNYTSIECYLTAEEYARLPYSLARLNGDLYNIAEVDGYDPLGGKKTKLKLIKRINK